MTGSNDDRCILCGGDMQWGGSVKASPVCVLSDDPIGRAQRRWLEFAGLPCPADSRSAENTIVLCQYHAMYYKAGTFALCPPLDDLAVLEDWETKDWEERLKANDARDRSLPPLETLSGSLAFVWLTYEWSICIPIAWGQVQCTSFGAYLRPEVRPPQVVLIRPSRNTYPGMPPVTFPTGDGKPGSLTEIQIQVDHVDDDGHRPCRLSPYVAMVASMHSVGNAYVPADIFVKVGRQKFPNIPNNGEEYHKRLRRLRQLYSRTTAECREERERMRNGTSSSLAM